MAVLTAQKRDLANHKWAGLTEQSHKVLECSECGAGLIGILEVKAKNQKTQIDNNTFYYKANCCYCGDSSYPVEIFGRHYVGPMDGVKLTTREDRNGVIILNTKKDGDV